MNFKIYIPFALSILISSISFAQESSIPSSFNEFDSTCHFKSQISKDDFYQLSGEFFTWEVQEKLMDYMEGLKPQKEKLKCFSPPQKALYYLIHLSTVKNNGWSTFYIEGYGEYVPELISSLKYIGDTEMVNMILQVDKIYQQNKIVVDKAEDDDEMWELAYSRLRSMSVYDEKFYNVDEKTTAITEEFIRSHSDEICIDEKGNDFKINENGVIQSYYPDGKIKSKFTLEEGKIEGEYIGFYENENKKEIRYYSKGMLSIEGKEFYKNGQLKYSIAKTDHEKIFKHEWFFEDGKAQKKEFQNHSLKYKDRIGEFKEWYPNGVLKTDGHFPSETDPPMPWLTYYNNGKPKLIAERSFQAKQKVINFWNEKGEQTLKDGTGSYINSFSRDEKDTTRIEENFKDYKLDGIQRRYENGIISSYKEMKEGVEDGVYRSYYKNGKIEREIIYENGNYVSSKSFKKFDNPKVNLTIKQILCEGCYKKKEEYILPDNKPKAQNISSIKEEVKSDVEMFRGYGEETGLSWNYVVYVDEKGAIKDFQMSSASNGLMVEEIDINIRKIKFEPAMKNGQAIESIHFVSYQFSLTE